MSSPLPEKSGSGKSRFQVHAVFNVWAWDHDAACDLWERAADQAQMVPLVRFATSTLVRDVDDE